ncbi:MAG: IS4/Tn5 family transposase DNA-binding protein, partial [Bryobacteraceae bacterium]
MITFLSAAASWAQHEFGFAQLGDRRRSKRLVNIAQHLAAHPGGTLPQAFPHWAELKAAYRFLGQTGVSHEQILAPHLARTRAACREPGEYLIIEDTTDLQYSHHPATEDLGYLSDGGGRGFELHSALAVRVEGWTLEQRPEGTIVGLLGQRCARPRLASAQESARQRWRRSRRSQRWAAALPEAGCPPAGSQWIYLADREADFYEPMRLCQRHGIDFVIRGFHDRRLVAEAGRLLATLAATPVLGEMTVEVRARPGQPARTARVEIRT